MRLAVKFPEDVRKQLLRRFKNKHREWLAASGNGNQPQVSAWPMEINLGVPTEKQALKREKREFRKEAPGHEAVATRDDLAGYGFITDETEEPNESENGSKS